ncbi:MAG: hypothetical protein WC867_03860 [Candidatus Pacearchaeota archaeon]|jgi:hypothetical protein
MKKREITILLIILAFASLLVYFPHFNNPFPIHVDEWHHITQAMLLKENGINHGSYAREIGFHFFLMCLILINKNIILYYKFLPLIWVILSCLVILYIIKIKFKENKNSFYIGLFAILFFVSIKSNVNITGLWFFTPLTFSIPFIYMYIFLFQEGLDKEKPKLLISSFLIMSILLFIHAISVLFAIPFLIIYSIIKLDKTKKLIKVLLIFILIPIIGLIFYKLAMNLAFLELFTDLFRNLQFEKGWGVLELKNSPFELYSFIGYLFSGLGIYYIIKNKEFKNNFQIYILWLFTVFIYILIFRLTGTSYLSPYQRNLYYLVLSLPILSAIGVYSFLIKINSKIKLKPHYKKIILILIIFLIFFLSFIYYFKIPENSRLYQILDKEDYNSLMILPNNPSYVIMAPLLISTAIYPVTANEPVGTLFFYGNRSEVDYFFNDTTDCNKKQEIIKRNNVDYIISNVELNCNWEKISSKNHIYKIK